MNRTELHAYQRQFLAIVQRAETEPMAVYHNNMIGMRMRALALIFPTCLRIVGEACFDAVAHEYITQFELSSSSLDDDGNEFHQSWQACIDTRPGFESLEYLPDLVRLERRRHDVYCAPEDQPFDWRQLHVENSMVDHIVDWSQAQPILCASFALFESSWPLLSLFGQRCDGGWFWIHRRSGSVTQGELTDEMFELLTAVSHGETMEMICHGEAQMALLQEAVSNGWIVGLRRSLPGEELMEASVESFT